MLQVANHSPFSASLSVFPDVNGVETAFAVVKATFNFGPDFPDGPVLAQPPLPLLATDVFWGDPITSSLRAVGEFGLLKPSTDILLVGRAYAPHADTRVADISLRVGPVMQAARVFGNRHWEKVDEQWRPSAPEPWTTMPLRWELAWGGVAPQEPGDEGEPVVDLRNPIGRGLCGRHGPVEGQPLPNFEDPSALIQAPEDRPVPMGFGAITPTWMPRRAYAGTYDDAWLKGRAPYLPKDFDPRFFQVAPPALIAPSFLQGGEPVVLQGFMPNGPLSFALPQCGLSLEFEFDGADVPGTPQMEMLLFEPDAKRFQMLWRAALPVDKKLLKLTQLTVRSSVYEKDGSLAKPLSGLNGMPRAYAAMED